MSEETTSETVRLINPFDGEAVDYPIVDVVKNGLDAYAWPEEANEIAWDTEDNAEWVEKVVEYMGAEAAGICIIGS